MKKKRTSRARTPETIEARRAKAERAFVDQHVERAAQANGDYRSFEVVDEIKTIEGGKEKVTSTKVVRNRGGTAVERWATKGDLDSRQIEAVTLYTKAWHRVFQEQRVVMNWSLTATFRGGAVGFEHFADSHDKAKRLLELMDNEVFFVLPFGHFGVWQNVVLFDEATGIAGARIGFKSKQAEAAAKLIVVTVSSMIANLMNLGAPRRAEEWLKTA